MTAQALAYSLFLAIPAAALVVLGVFSLVADPTLIQAVVERAGRVMPTQATQLLQDSLERSAKSTRAGVVMTVFGFALALWSTTSAATTLMSGLTRAHDREDGRSFVRKRLLALAIVIALVSGAGLVLCLLVLGPHVEGWIGSALGLQAATAWVWWTAQWPILIGGLLFVFAVVLYLGPDVEQTTLRLITPGAVAAVVVWLVASGGFALYAAHFGSYEKSWGALSTVVVTLVWLWATSAALLFGAEVDQARRFVEEREASSNRPGELSRAA